MRLDYIIKAILSLFVGLILLAVFKAGEMNCEKNGAKKAQAELRKQITARQKIDLETSRLEDDAVDDRLASNGWLRDRE
jgi:hypothetical protein